MAYLLRTEEKKSKKLNLTKFHLHIPKSDLVGMLVLVLGLTNLLTIYLTKKVDSGVLGLLIGLTLYYVLRREEEIQEHTKQGKAGKDPKGEIKVLTIPDPSE